MAKICRDRCGEWYGGNNALTEKQQKFNAKAVARYCGTLSSHQWSKKSIQAICGNMAAESHINPQRYQSGIVSKNMGYGLVQWTPQTNLIDRAKKIKQYKSYDMMYTQMCVIDWEADNNKQWIKTSAYPITFKEFMENEGNHTLEYLVGAWLKNYERPADQSQSVIDYRTQRANEVTSSINWDNVFKSPIDDFLEWLKDIADNNEYVYEIGANHGVPWDNYKTLKEFDCSSYISFGLHNGGGYDLETQFSTGNAKSELVELGFKAIAFKNKKQCKRGDVLVRTGSPYGHTEAVYSTEGNGKLIGAHGDVGISPPNQISIVDFTDTNWEWILRSDDVVSSKPRENPTNSNKSSRAKNPKTPPQITQNSLPPTFLKRRRRF